MRVSSVPVGKKYVPTPVPKQVYPHDTISEVNID